MDLGLRGRRAIVCAASKGLGRACATALAREGVAVVITGRDLDTLERTARAIAQETGSDIGIAPGDIATEAGRAAALAACPDPDILVNNAGGPPPGDFRDWERADWLRALDANMLAPIALIKAVIDGMIGRRFGRIVNITSASVKSPIPQLGMSNGARAGLTGFTGGLARQVARHNVTINNLLPGPFVTDRLRSTMAGAAAQSGRTIEAEMAARAEQNPTGRFGDPEEFGRACAFLCAASSGYIVGQNLLLDGGAFNATMG
jgi:3-oxoacyl-[acyl-carrier protein] reductase